MEEYMSLNFWTLRMIGVWYPKKSSPLVARLHGIMLSLTVASVFFILVPAAVGARERLRRFTDSPEVETLTLLLSASVVVFKVSDVVLRRKRVRVLLERMSEFWGETTRNGGITGIKGFAETGRRVTRCYVVLGVFNVVFFAGQPFLTSFLSVEKNSSIIVDRLPFEGWQSYVDARPSIVFGFLFALQVVAGTLASAASIAYDCLFVVLLLHVCGNLRAIALSLQDFRTLNPQRIEKELVRCVEQFRELIEYTRELESILSIYLLAQSLASTVIICLTSFLVIRDINSNKELGKYVSYCSAAMFQIFIFCWAGNNLQTEAHMVGQSAYDAYGGLMNLDFKDQEFRRSHLFTKIPRYLQMILLRSQTPLTITAGKFYAMSLPNFKNILSSSYSYLTILRAFVDQKSSRV